MKIIKKINSMPLGLKSGLVYTIATIITRGLAVITTPIFTRTMTSSQIGVTNLYNTWYSTLSVLATLSLTSGGFQLAMKEYSDCRDKYESSVLSITTLSAIIIDTIILLNINFFSKVFGISKVATYLLCFGLLVAPARDFWMARQRYEYKYKLSGFISIISAVGASFLSIMFVIYMNNHDMENTADGRLLGNYLVIYSFCSAFWIYLFLKGKTFYNKEFWKFSLSISIPLVGYALAKQVLDVSDRVMIDKLVGKSAVGIYSTLYSVSTISLIIWNAINASYVPFLYKNIDDKKKHNEINKVAIDLLLLFSLVAIVLTYLAPEVVLVLATKEYFSAISIMPPIAGGIFLTSVSNMYSNILIYYKKPIGILLSSSIAAGLNIVLNAIFIPMIGYQAAAYTTLIDRKSVV